MTFRNLIHGSASNASAQFEKAMDGDILILEALEQEFSSIGCATGSERSASTEKSLALATADLRDFIGFEFSLMQEVDSVFTAFREKEVFYVWIVTDQFETAVRERLYARQQVIIDEFPMFEFDFYIIARAGRDIQDLIGDTSMHLTYQRK